MINDKYYEMLVFINDCPDWAISREVFINSKKWTADDIDLFLQLLERDQFVTVYSQDNLKRYRVSNKGNLFIKSYKIDKHRINMQVYVFPIITSIASLILSILIGQLLN